MCLSLRILTCTQLHYLFLRFSNKLDIHLASHCYDYMVPVVLDTKVMIFTLLQTITIDLLTACLVFTSLSLHCKSQKEGQVY